MPEDDDRRWHIEIHYKSGRTQKATCKKFDATTRGGQLVAIDFNDIHPVPLFLGIDDIESVFKTGQAS